MTPPRITLTPQTWRDYLAGYAHGYRARYAVPQRDRTPAYRAGWVAGYGAAHPGRLRRTA